MQESLNIEIFGFDKSGVEREFDRVWIKSKIFHVTIIGELGTGTKVFSSGSLVLPLKPVMWHSCTLGTSQLPSPITAC